MNQTAGGKDKMKLGRAGSVPNRFFSVNLKDMDSKVILWIIGLVIYFYIQSRKRKNQSEPDQQEEPPQPRPRPVSFEDLLREIQASREPAPPPPPPPVPQAEPEFIDYDDEKYREPTKDLEEESMASQPDAVSVQYEAGKSAAFQHTSLEESMTLEQTDMGYGKFRVYDKTETPAYVQVLAKEFQDKENLKKAFILKEILDRRF